MAPRAPADEGELAERLATASREGAPVALTGAEPPRSVSSLPGSEGGRAAEPPVWLLSLGATAFRGIVSLEPEEGRVSVRAGTRVADLVRELAAAGQWLPAAAGVLGGSGSAAAGGGSASAPGGSVGGLVCRASPGPFEAAYGGLRRHLLAVVTTSHRGRSLRWGRGVMKDVAGYDMKALWCGSRGRLGALTAATLRTWALPAERRAYRFPAHAAEATALGLDPEAAAVRPDGIRWGWDPEAREVLEVWLLGSAVAVEERAAALFRWARRRGLPDPEVALGVTPRALATGGAVTGRPRAPAEGVLRLRAAPERLPALAQALRREAGESAVGLELLPQAGVAWLGYRRAGATEGHGGGPPAGGVGRLLAAAKEAAPDVAVAIDRGGADGHAAAAEARPDAARTLEASLLAALHGRPAHWVADYV